MLQAIGRTMSVMAGFLLDILYSPYYLLNYMMASVSSWWNSKSNEDIKRKEETTAQKMERTVQDLDLLRATINAGNINMVDEEDYSWMDHALEYNLQAVQVLVDAGVDLNHPDAEGQTFLMQAIEGENLEAVEALIKAGADLCVKSKKGLIALDYAVLDSVPGALRSLLDAGNIDAQLAAKGNEESILHDALIAATGREEDASEVVLMLINAKIGLNARYQGNTAMTYAARNNSIDIVKAMVENGTDLSATNEIGETALRAAVSRKKPEIVQLLLNVDNPIDVYADFYYSAFHPAVMEGQNDIAKMLMDVPGIDVNYLYYDGQTIMTRAIRTGKEKAVQLLIDLCKEKGVLPLLVNDLNWNRQTPLMQAMYERNTHITQMLLDAGSDISLRNMDDRTAVEQAVEDYDLEVLAYLIKDKKIEDNPVFSLAFIYAMDSDRFDCAQMLLDAGADVAVAVPTLPYKRNLLFSILSEEILAFLQKNNIDLNVQDQAGKTPLIHHTEYGDDETVTLLLKAGADIDFVSETGLTALKRAIDYDRAEVVRVLIDHGVNLTIGSPLEHAESLGHHRCVDLLKAAMEASNDQVVSKDAHADTNMFKEVVDEEKSASASVTLQHS